MKNNNLLDLLSDEKIADAIKKNNHLAVAKHIGKLHCNFTEYDEKFIDLFWDPVFNSSWIYLSDELVIDWMGYKKTKDTMTNFYKEMKDKYKEGADYEEVTKTHELVVKFCSCFNTSKKDDRIASNKKYYIITGNTLKKMLMRAGTKKGDIICDYFIKVESLASLTHQAIFKFLQVKKDEELKKKDQELTKSNQIIKQKNVELKRISTLADEYVSFKKKLERNETIYIISSYLYAREGMFKIGKTTKKINVRNSGHNNTRLPGDRMKVLKEFKVNSCDLVEKIIHNKLEGLRASKNTEFFHCPFNLLVRICDNIVHGDEVANELVNSIIDTVHLLRNISNGNTAEWTAELDMDIFKDELTLVTAAGQIEAKFDMTTATDEQKENFVSECIKAYQRTVALPQAATVVWKALKDFLAAQLCIPTYKFRANDWKKYAIKLDGFNDHPKIKWRESTVSHKLAPQATVPLQITEHAATI